MAQAKWRENRAGELYFVEADRTAAGWVFSERSTYESRWFTIPPKTGWVERAEWMTAKGGADSPRPATRPDVEVGDFNDNAGVLATANWRIDNGAITEALSMLYALQDYIAATRDQKSRIILGPVVEKAIERAYRRQQAIDENPASTPRTASTVAGSTSKASDGIGHNDLASRVKLRLIDAVGIVTALCWTHSILVHEITTLAGLGDHPAGAHLASVSVLAILLRVAAKGIR